MRAQRLPLQYAMWVAGPLALLTVAVSDPGVSGPRHGRTIAADYRVAISRAARMIEGHRQALNVPGMQVAVSVGGRLVWSQGFGTANLEDGTPVTSLTRFRVGSVSKALTSAAVALLVDRGRLDLDAPIQRYVPSFPVKRWPITARELGGHLSGIRHYAGREEGISQRRYETVIAALDVFANDSLLFEPGTRMYYSSYGFNLLSAVVEGAAGTPFLSFMYDSVFASLGMSKTSADVYDSIIPHRSAFYVRGRDGRRVNAPYDDLSVKWAGGGMLSTAEDLVRFARSLWAGDFVSPSTVNLLFTSQETRDGRATGYGIGWEVTTDNSGRRLFSHGGLLQSGRAHLLLYPDDDLCVAILANTGDGLFFNEGEAQEIADLFLNASDVIVPSAAAIDSWVGLWEFEMQHPRSQEMVGAWMEIEPDGSELQGWVSTQADPRGVTWRIPLAMVRGQTLEATAIPGSHVRFTLERQGDEFTGSWRFVTAPTIPGLLESLPEAARGMMESRGQPHPIRNGRRIRSNEGKK